MSAYLSFLTVLGWSLLDSIWQMAILWLAYSVLTTGNNRISPAGKHNLVLLFVFIGTEWFVYTFFHLLSQPTPEIATGFIPFNIPVNRWIPAGTCVYLLILAIRAIQYLAHRKKLYQRLSGKELSPSYQMFADRYARLLGITRRVQVYLSELSETAETGGFFKPFILLPFSMITRLSPQQVEAILVHELYHIRRNDYLVNILMTCFRNIFFFNPFARLFYKTLTRERELACDDGVIEMGFEPGLYANALYSLEKFRQTEPGFLLAADGHKPWLLMERIRRLLGNAPVYKKRISPLLSLILFTSIILSGLRHKTSPSLKATPNTILPVSVKPVRYEVTEDRFSVVSPAPVTEYPKPGKIAKKQKISEPPPAPDAVPKEESDPADQAFFADNTTIREFSNQAAAALSQDVVPETPGSPYVPSASFYYESIPVIIAEDSIKTMIIQHGLKDMIRLSRMKSIACLKTLEIEVEKNKKLLNQVEMKNGDLIKKEQKGLKIQLDKIRKQMDVRKQKINHLRIRLQDSEEEIIHI
jgi:Zn-dependent protease with chaperone function